MRVSNVVGGENNRRKENTQFQNMLKLFKFTGYSQMVEGLQNNHCIPPPPCTRSVAGARGNREPWEEKISTSQIWSNGFKLTLPGHLPLSIKDDLEKYDQY